MPRPGMVHSARTNPDSSCCRGLPAPRSSIRSFHFSIFNFQFPLVGRAFLFALCALLASGCAEYRFGNRSLYRSDLRTIHVPIFTSAGFRRDLGEQLTEAVVKEIQLRSPYTIVSSPDADSVLSGRIARAGKHLLVENENDEARAIEFDVAVHVNWVDRRGAVMMREVVVPISPLNLAISADADLIPEAGQSLATARQQALRQAASEIVTHMEMRW